MAALRTRVWRIAESATRISSGYRSIKSPVRRSKGTASLFRKRGRHVIALGTKRCALGLLEFFAKLPRCLVGIEALQIARGRVSTCQLPLAFSSCPNSRVPFSRVHKIKQIVRKLGMSGFPNRVRDVRIGHGAHGLALGKWRVFSILRCPPFELKWADEVESRMAADGIVEAVCNGRLRSRLRSPSGRWCAGRLRP
jgi:hypothetical protein